MSRSKSLTRKTHSFLTSLGLQPMGGVEKIGGMQIEASVMRKSVKALLKNFQGTTTVELNGVRLVPTLRIVPGKKLPRERISLTVYRKGSWDKFGWVTFIMSAHSQVVQVIFDNEF